MFPHPLKVFPTTRLTSILLNPFLVTSSSSNSFNSVKRRDINADHFLYKKMDIMKILINQAHQPKIQIPKEITHRFKEINEELNLMETLTSKHLTSVIQKATEQNNNKFTNKDLISSNKKSETKRVKKLIRFDEYLHKKYEEIMANSHNNFSSLTNFVKSKLSKINSHLLKKKIVTNSCFAFDYLRPKFNEYKLMKLHQPPNNMIKSSPMKKQNKYYSKKILKNPTRNINSTKNFKFRMRINQSKLDTAKLIYSTK